MEGQQLAFLLEELNCTCTLNENSITCTFNLTTQLFCFCFHSKRVAVLNVPVMSIGVQDAKAANIYFY